MDYFILNSDGFVVGVTSTPSEGEVYTKITPPESFKQPRFLNGEWTDSLAIPKLSPIEFKMLFTSAERIAIKSSTDLVVQDFFELVNDPRLTQVDRNLQSVKDAITYLASIGLVADTRVSEILG